MVRIVIFVHNHVRKMSVNKHAYLNSKVCVTKTPAADELYSKIPHQRSGRKFLNKLKIPRSLRNAPPTVSQDIAVDSLPTCKESLSNKLH